jgi:hypothetical protein
MSRNGWSTRRLAPAGETRWQLLNESPGPLMRQQFLARRPKGERQLDDSLERFLTRGSELGSPVRTGAGNKGKAFRYGATPARAIRTQA